MSILDCETRESALVSVASICGIERSAIIGFLETFDLEDYCNNHDCSSGEGALYEEFEKTYRCTIMQPARIYWFHMTRCMRGCSFSDGLLPLAKARHSIWHTIHQVFEGTEHMPFFLKLEQAPSLNGRYEGRLHSPDLQGPYGFLIREVADKPSANGIHDYLKMPETMADICCAYKARYGVEIEHLLSDALVPVIVKFWTPVFRHDYAEIALYYLYNVLHNLPQKASNTCYDGHNTAVPAEQIEKVDFVSSLPINHDNRKEDNASQATLASRPTGRISETSFANCAAGANIYSFSPAEQSL